MVTHLPAFIGYLVWIGPDSGVPQKRRWDFGGGWEVFVVLHEWWLGFGVDWLDLAFSTGYNEFMVLKEECWG